MPRRNRPKRGRKRAEETEDPLMVDLDVGAPHGWTVRLIQPARAQKPYTCPGCNRQIHPGTSHVVAWRDGEEDLRRHWHRPCWEREARRLTH